jgi:hypothetical protein
MHRVAQNSIEDGVSYTDPRKRMLRNAVAICVLPRNNFRNGVPARCFAKMPLVISTFGQ